MKVKTEENVPLELKQSTLLSSHPPPPTLNPSTLSSSEKKGPVNPNMSIPRAYFWHLPFCCFENAPLWDRSQGTKQKLQRLKVCFNGQALIGELHDHVFPLFIYLFVYLLFTGCLLFIISICLCFCSRPFLKKGSPPNRI